MFKYFCSTQFLVNYFLVIHYIATMCIEHYHKTRKEKKHRKIEIIYDNNYNYNNNTINDNNK